MIFEGHEFVDFLLTPRKAKGISTFNLGPTPRSIQEGIWSILEKFRKLPPGIRQKSNAHNTGGTQGIHVKVKAEVIDKDEVRSIKNHQKTLTLILKTSKNIKN